ncbi:MAG: ABC transporter permease, partial [Sphingopyxis sp.]
MATAFTPADSAHSPQDEGASPAVIRTPEPAPSGTPEAVATGPAWGKRIGGHAKGLLAPLMGIIIFLCLWAISAPMVTTSLGALPGPGAVAQQGGALYTEWAAARADRAAFYAAQDSRNAAAIAAGNAAGVQEFAYTGSPTFPGQVLTSLETVALGFVLASI